MNRRTMLLGSIGAVVGAALPGVKPSPHAGFISVFRQWRDELGSNRRCTLGTKFAGGGTGMEYFDSIDEMIARCELLPDGAGITACCVELDSFFVPAWDGEDETAYRSVLS
jgi:hypothetical protein